MAVNSDDRRSNGYTFGMEVKPSDIIRILTDAIHFNVTFAGPRKGKGHSIENRSVFVWGPPGIGKTAIVENDVPRQLIKRYPEVYKNKKVVTVVIPMAQLSEPGDLSGMPYLDKMEITEIAENGKEKKVVMETTRLAPPDFAAKLIKASQDGNIPVLVIDDYNRGGNHMLKASMQLIQKLSMVDWELPPETTIILTGNQEGGDHGVTELDQALKTRLSHITMKSDLDQWVEWAEADGTIDERVILFLMTHKDQFSPTDAVTHGGTQHEPRTTPRTWTRFGQFLKFYNPPHRGPGSKEGIRVIRQEAQADLDEHVAESFTGALIDLGEKFPTPEEILYNYDSASKKLAEFANNNKQDRISMCMGFVMMYLKSPEYDPGKDPKLKILKENIEKMFEDPKISSEIVYRMLYRLYNSSDVNLKSKVRSLLPTNQKFQKRLLEII